MQLFSFPPSRRLALLHGYSVGLRSPQTSSHIAITDPFTATRLLAGCTIISTSGSLVAYILELPTFILGQRIDGPTFFKFSPVQPNAWLDRTNLNIDTSLKHVRVQGLRSSGILCSV